MKTLWWLIFAILPFTVYFLKISHTPQRDWDYFNSFAMLLRESTLNGRLPGLDHWVCGGSDLLANPQNWVFSPLLIFNLIFGSYLGNLITWLVCAIFGFYGMYRLGKQTKSELHRSMIAALFVLSSFFFLHLGEGHLTFRTFYFLPWILYFSENLRYLKDLLALASLLAFMFLDGGLYPFYYSILLMLLNLNWTHLRGLLQDRTLRKNIVILGFAFLFLIAAKALPVLGIHYQRTPETEQAVYSLANIYESFYNVYQTNFKALAGQKYLFHEYGQYLGFGITLAFAYTLKFARRQKWVLIQIILFAWIALGLGGVINPWTLIKRVPMINQFHVQSRSLIIMYLMILVFIQRTELPKKLGTALLLLACAELSFVAFYVSRAAFTESRKSSEISILTHSGPLNHYEHYIPAPEVYHSEKISYACYEHAKENFLKPTSSLFLISESTDLSAKFEANHLTIVSPIEMKDKLVLNYNWNGGWDCEDCTAIENEGLIQINPSHPTKRLQLTYRPFFSQASLAFYLIGLFLLFYSIFRKKNGI